MTHQLSFVYAPVSVLVVIFLTNPFYTSILAYLVNGEVMQRFEVIGMVLCFTGICVLAYTVNKIHAGPDVAEFGSTQLTGVFIMLISAFTFSVQCVFTRKLKDLHFTQLAGSHGLVGLTISLSIVLV